MHIMYIYICVLNMFGFGEDCGRHAWGPGGPGTLAFTGSCTYPHKIFQGLGPDKCTSCIGNWGGESVSFSCQDPPKFTQNISFPSAFNQFFVLPVFAYPFRGH